MLNKMKNLPYLPLEIWSIIFVHLPLNETIHIFKMLVNTGMVKVETNITSTCLKSLELKIQMDKNERKNIKLLDDDFLKAYEKVENFL
jgi:rRNA-processing protein FCF1